MARAVLPALGKRKMERAGEEEEEKQLLRKQMGCVSLPEGTGGAPAGRSGWDKGSRR